MAKIIAKANGKIGYEDYFKPDAIDLYNAGYRKASDIFEEIEREIKNHGICYTQRKIAELKKKYTEEGK